MTDFCALLANLRRPRLLIRAARFGLCDYRRDRDLRRWVEANALPDSAFPHLLREEERIEHYRKAGDASYSIARHIEVLIALMAEARLVQRVATAV